MRYSILLHLLRITALTLVFVCLILSQVLQKFLSHGQRTSSCYLFYSIDSKKGKNEIKINRSFMWFNLRKFSKKTKSQGI